MILFAKRENLWEAFLEFSMGCGRGLVRYISVKTKSCCFKMHIVKGRGLTVRMVSSLDTGNIAINWIRSSSLYSFFTLNE